MHGLPLVEDAAEALGSRRGDIHCGLFGAVSTLSFNGNKLITTGGGALITNDAELAHRRATCQQLPRFLILGRLNTMLGVGTIVCSRRRFRAAQLEDQRRLETKRQLADRFYAAVSNLDNVEFVAEPAACSSNYWLISLRFTSRIH